MMQKGKIAKNTISSLLLQICSVLCGFIIPRLILSSYGSEVNGLVNSITQFLSFIAVLDLGVGAVVQSSLYKPLADKDENRINAIITSADKFFRTIGSFLLVYVIILMIIYPFIAKQDFGHLYTATLIAAISISSFAQYYFGVVDRLLLTADQRGYIQFNAQIVTLLLNTLACAILIKLGFSIHIVKLITSLIYLARPIYLRQYINKHYKLNRKVRYTEEPVKQKWNGMAQHISAVVLNETDVVVLTIWSTLSAVSIYSVYNLVVSGLKKLFETSTNGVEAALGELWAKEEYEGAERLFSQAEWVIHTAVTYVFSCTAVLIVPFVMVYTKGITDADYSQPLFALLIVLAHTVHCYRLPYHMLIKAVGHYKQTQRSYAIASAVNLVISIVSVSCFGLIGVAIGTLAAMTYQTIWMARYNSLHLIKGAFSRFVKQLVVDAVSFMICYFAFAVFMTVSAESYFQWALEAVKVAFLAGIAAVIVNWVFYKQRMITLLHTLKARVRP